MRLLVITNRCPVSADDPASPFVPHFVAALQGCGVTVDVLTPRYLQGDAVSRKGEAPVEPSWVHRFASGSAIPIGSWSLSNPANWLRLRRFLGNGFRMGTSLCRDHSYDHILALWALPSGYFARRLSRRFGVPYSVWCLGSDVYTWAKRPVLRGLIAGVLTGASLVFGDGDDLCRRVETWLGVKCYFLPSFRPLAGLTAEHPPGATDAPRYLYLGRLHRAKGVFELVTAFAQVHCLLPRSTLCLVGDGPDAARLLRMVASQRTGDSVRLVGATDTDGVIRELQSADFVVIPTKSDSLPLVFSEAVQAYRPVIGTDVGDLGVSIRKYQVGLVTPSVDPADLSATMVAMASAPIFNRQGRDELMERLDLGRAAGTFLRLASGMRDRPRGVDSETVEAGEVVAR